MNRVKLKAMLEPFFIEDIGDMDITTDMLFAPEAQGSLKLMAKANGVFCGEDVINEGFHTIDPSLSISIEKRDGEEVKYGDAIAVITGAVASLLKGERVVLNLIQRMSGIASKTSTFVKRIEGTGAKICDTRKTTPGLRMLEKYAVRCGGGFNHRMGLADSVLIKDNHIDFAGSITEAVNEIRGKIGHTVKVEVEIETKEQLMEAIEAGVDIIMFDNRTPAEIREWLSIVPVGILTEASGGITLDNIRDYALSGVDYISLGCLTHTIEAFDISAKVKNRKTVMEA
ncbi:carboxylating nicotinate-nucleotide diphosphorylase [Falsibacillus pallidus]|uniref:Probable nicotinate-nucleotide pyrophosphorylase [carboxylating] n=1 Tax=Falsibacillus pallidus TaxID=493781 RepID=A0A370GKD9_9BACI|nr:carboxylating nicotinate-nucleotide diphosphorylase [Falsibacillus pallidus]RDI44131.1 nicotinate-nucleotide pyrophosphorylase [carboxylating] [Falsibacillus pallidus]